MNAPKVSVGLPVYNAQAYVAKTIESILSQDFADFELVISDNGSTDGTAGICSAFAERDSRVRYFRSEVNRGATWNFNRVFELSRGEYFKWQAYDDLCLPAFVSACLLEHEAAAGAAVLVYPKARTIDEQGEPLAGFVEVSVDARDPRPHRRVAGVVRNLSMASAFYGLVRAAELRRTRLLGKYMAADYVLLAELAMLGEIREVPQVLFLRRVHPQISTYANRTATALLQWFDPSAKAQRIYIPPRIRVGIELVKATRSLQLAPKDRLLCCLAGPSVWYWRLFKNFAGRYRRKLSGVMTGASRAAG